MTVSLPDFGYVVWFVETLVLKSIDGFPPYDWWIPACVLMILGATAAVDAFTAIVPDLLIIPGFLAFIALLGFSVSWPVALHALSLGVAAGALVLLLDILWFLAFKRNALGMGDAKWTMFAVTAYGVMPVLISWGIGAWLAVGWILAAKLMRRPTPYVHFAPFLFVGLIGGLWWQHMR